MLLITSAFFAFTAQSAATHLTPEYRYHNHWTSGDTRVVVCEGEELILSVLPNHLTPTWTGPNGLRRRTQNLDLGSVSQSEAGVYTATYRYSNGYKTHVCIVVDVLAEPKLTLTPTGETCVGHDGAIDLEISHLPHGVFFERWDGALHALPHSYPVSHRGQSGISKNGFDIGLSERHDNYYMRFTATLDVPRHGWYQFFTASDDGSKLFIDGAQVVDNDGLHGMRERSGWVELTAGNHQIEVTYFERLGDVGLRVKWDGPGFGKQTIPNDRLRVPYSIHWNNGACTEDLANIDDGTYTVEVKYGGNNCSVTGTTTVTPGRSYVTGSGEILTDNAFYCITDGSGSFDPPAFQTTPATCAGDKEPDYLWQVKESMTGNWLTIAGATGQDYDPAPRGQGSKWYRRLSKCNCDNKYYWAGVTDVRDIHVFDQPDATITVTNTDCATETGSITFTYDHSSAGQYNDLKLSIDGGNSFVTVQPNSGTYTFSDLAPGTYEPVIKTELSDCRTDFASVTIDPQPTLEANFDIGVSTVCSDTEVSFVALGQEPGATYTWDFGPFASPQSLDGPGPHVVTFYSSLPIKSATSVRALP